MKKLNFFLLSTLFSLLAAAQVPVFTAGIINDSVLYSGNVNDTLKQVYNLTQTSSIDLNQDVTITVSGLYNEAALELDTIVLVDLTNGTQAVLSNLPAWVTNYEINLSK
jgi:hypothetical protein